MKPLSPISSPIDAASQPSSGRRWTGRILTGVAVLFLLFDGGAKVLQLHQAVEGTVGLGFAASDVLPIGVIELVALTLFLVPQASLLGVTLLTAYLGGAVAANVRAQTPLVSHALFPIYFAAILWGGYLLREARVAQVFPFIRSRQS